MSKVEDIKVLNIDGVPHAVDTMSDAVKAMVDVYNGWSRKEEAARDEVMLIQAARHDLSRQIVMQVRKENEPNDETNQESTGGDETNEAVTPITEATTGE